MVARGAGAAGPVLLACRRWDPLGLARRLPSLGVGAWRYAPLLPWRGQCPVRVCAALAAGSGGSGRYLVLCLSRFPLPASRVPRCVWRAVPSGCPLPSLAGTPFHAVCAFRVLGPVALLVVPACPLRVCALALPQRPLPPLLGGVACAPRAVPALGASRAVPRGRCPSACPAPVPCSVWRAWGGGGPVPVPPYLAWGCGSGGRASPGRRPSTVARGVWGQALPLPRLPAHWAGYWSPVSTCCGRGRPGVGALLCPLGLHALWGLRAAGRVRGVRVPGGGEGGGGGVRRAPRLCGRGGPVGRGVAVPRSVPLPSLGKQQSGCHLRRSVHGGRGPPYHSGSCSPAFTGRDLCGILARWRGLACSPRFLWEPAAGAGGQVALRLLSRAGGGGPSPLPRGVGAGAPAACGPVGGVGGGGRSRRGLPAPPLGGGPRYPVLAPLVPSAHSPPACTCGRGRGAAPGWGGMRGGPWTAPPGAPADLNPPSALPEWAVVTGGSCGAQPPYCSGAPPCAAPKLGARVAPARWCGLALRPRPPRKQAAGGAGVRGVQVQPHPPPPRRGPFWRRGGVPSAPGGQRVAPVAPKLGGGSGGGGGAPPRPPAPSGVGLPSVVSGVPPRGILVPWGLPGGRGRRARSGRPPTGQCGGGGGGGGGGNPPALFRAPVFPGPASDRAAPFAPSWAPAVRRRPAAGRACGRLPRPWCPRTPGAAASSGGVRGRRFFGLPPSALGPEWEGGGGVGGGPWSPGATS